MKGFLSFTLVLAMIIVLLWLSVAGTKNAFELEKTKNELIKAEQANKERTLLENNFDKIVKIKLEEQIMLGNFNVHTAQNEINSAIAKYLIGKANTSNLMYEKTGEINKEFLNENTSVQILKAQGVVYAEYVYASNLMKNSIISKKLGNKIISYFKVPIGYTQKKIQII